MNERAQRTLRSDRTIDIITVARLSRRPRRLEIWFHQVREQVCVPASLALHRLMGYRAMHCELEPGP